MHRVRRRHVFAAHVAERGQVDAGEQRFARAEQGRREREVQLVDEARSKVLADRRRAAANPNVGYFAGGSLVSSTSNAGVTFAPTTNLPECCIIGIVADPNVASAAYAALPTGIYKTVDSGNTWNRVSGNTFLLNSPSPLTLARTNPGPRFTRSST